MQYKIEFNLPTGTQEVVVSSVPQEQREELKPKLSIEEHKIPRKSVHEFISGWVDLMNNPTVSCHKCGEVIEGENVKDFGEESLKGSISVILCSTCADELLEGVFEESPLNNKGES